jgi:hypothetical protein
MLYLLTMKQAGCLFDAEVEFIIDDKGRVIKAILYQNGIHEAKKVE